MKEFVDALVEISRHFGVLERDQICCGDVTVAQCLALQRLQGSPGGVSTLAAYLGTSVSATTRLVQGLEKRDWVQRRADPEDGRRVQLELTDAGVQKAGELNDSTAELASQLLEFIPEDQQPQVISALSTLGEALTKCRTKCCNVGEDEITSCC